MNQKRFINIIVIIIAVVLIGTVAYFVLIRQFRSSSIPTPNQKAPTASPITISGETACLPKTGQGTQTLECTIGLRETNGRYYGLKNLFKIDPEYKFSVDGLRVKASGLFNSEEMRGPDGDKYDVVGTIDVISIKKIEAGTSTVQPEDPNKADLVSYPDLPLISLSQQPFSIKSIVEHRSALNGKTISIRGVIISTLLGEKACPHDRGMCVQPSIFLADTTDKNRNALFDLRVLVSEEEQEKNYAIGKIVDLQVVINSSKVSVVAQKTY